MLSKRIQSHVFSVLLLVSLSACSGGSDTETPSPAALPASPAEGLWTGTTNTNRTVTGVVLDNGAYWALYYSMSGPSLNVLGFIQGESNSQNGTFTSSSASDFNPDRIGLFKAEIDGTYTTKQSLNGKIVYQNNAQPDDTFTTTYQRVYESAPDINAVVGTYTGPVSINENVSVTVSSTGDIVGHSINVPCTFNGLFKPRAHGNVFDVTITFNGEQGCSNGNGTVKGVGFLYNNKLYSAALNDDKSNGVVFIGTK